MKSEKVKEMLDSCYMAKRILDMLPKLPEGVLPSYVCKLLNRIQKSISEKLLSEKIRNNTKNNVKYGFFYVIIWKMLLIK